MASRSRPQKGKNSNNKGNTFTCAHCGEEGHSKLRCYEIIGYQEWWDFSKKPRKKIGQATVATSSPGQEGSPPMAAHTSTIPDEKALRGPIVTTIEQGLRNLGAGPADLSISGFLVLLLSSNFCSNRQHHIRIQIKLMKSEEAPPLHHSSSPPKTHECLSVTHSSSPPLPHSSSRTQEGGDSPAATAASKGPPKSGDQKSMRSLS
ncbi:hypothetical protein LXL04_020814 [Taraxacum kok-saghyz]